MELRSPAFGNGETIPVKYTCSGERLSPPLRIGNAPKGTKSFALIMDDPDAPAGTFVHWLVWNVRGEAKEIAEGARGIGPEGMNTAGRLGYTPPCPPGGPPHTYRFKLYALDAPLELEAGADLGQLEEAMEGHVLARAELDGKFGR